MIEQHPGPSYTVSPRQLGREAHVDSEGYLQVGRSQQLPDSVTVTVSRASTEAER